MGQLVCNSSPCMSSELSDVDLLVQQRCGWKPGRLRREDCQSVKHDKLFSKWKILMGPASDSTEHMMNESAGTKVGIYTHHVHNLPAGAQFAGPGVYELGVTAPSWSKAPGSDFARALKREDVIPVYIGQAANVRQRLHKYGQFEHASATRSQGENSPRIMAQNGEAAAKAASGSGPRLFSEVFALGSSIAYRWAHTDSKVVAEQVEAELLSVFDYAWNKCSSSGTRRSRDILAKLFMAWPTKQTTTSSSRLRNLILPGKRSPRCHFFCRGTNAVGIKVALRKPHEPSQYSTLSNLCFLMTVQPRPVIAPPRKQRPAASTKVVQAETTRGRRNSLSFNTWVKGETDQRVHDSSGMSALSAHNVSSQKSSDSKRRVQHLRPKYASVSDSDSVMRR